MCTKCAKFSGGATATAAAPTELHYHAQTLYEPKSATSATSAKPTSASSASAASVCTNGLYGNYRGNIAESQEGLSLVFLQ